MMQMSPRGAKRSATPPRGPGTKKRSKAKTPQTLEDPDTHSADALAADNELPHQEAVETEAAVDAALEHTMLEILGKRQPGKTC